MSSDLGPQPHAGHQAEARTSALPPGAHVATAGPACPPPRRDELLQLLNLSMRLHSLQNLEELLNWITQAATEVMEAEDASIMLVDPTSQRLHFAAIHSPHKESLQSVTLAMGEGIAGWVAQSGEIVVVDDTYADPRFSRKGDQASGHRTASMICIPLRTRSGILGTLEIVNRKTGPFAQSEVCFCQPFANIAAIAIENALLVRAKEQALARVQELQRSRKEFISILSHEFRTPLTVIKGGLYLLQNRELMPPDALDIAVRSMTANAARLQRMVSDIFIVNDIEALGRSTTRRAINLVEMLEVFRDFYSDLESSPTLEMALPSREDLELYTVDIDREKMVHVISHLLDNAHKFSPRDTTVQLALERQDDPAGFIIRVRDQGIGIPPHLIESMFELFVQGDSSPTREYEGAGIGLFLSRRIVEAHGGRLTCTSVPGQGSDFHIFLPAIP